MAYVFRAGMLTRSHSDGSTSADSPDETESIRPSHSIQSITRADLAGYGLLRHRGPRPARYRIPPSI
jgi:hypothetical protein